MKKITKKELFGLNERVIEEERLQLKKTDKDKNENVLNSGFCNQSHCSYIPTNEVCENHLQGEKCRYSKCIYIEGQTRRDKDRQGLTGTDKDRQGQTRTIRDRQGQARTERDCPCLSLFVPALSLFVPALSLPVPAMSLALTGIVGK